MLQLFSRDKGAVIVQFDSNECQSEKNIGVDLQERAHFAGLSLVKLPGVGVGAIKYVG